MYFTLCRLFKLLKNKTVAKLSQYILIGLLTKLTTLKSWIKFCKQITRQVASKHATYSTSIVKDIVLDCLALFQDTIPPVMMNT